MYDVKTVDVQEEPLPGGILKQDDITPTRRGLDRCVDGGVLMRRRGRCPPRGRGRRNPERQET